MTLPGQLRVSVRQQTTRTTLALDGELDLATAPTLRQHVVTQVAAGCRSMVLDLSGVTFLDSTGLGQIVATLKRLRSHDGELVIVVSDRRIRRVLELCDLDRILDLRTTVPDEAGHE